MRIGIKLFENVFEVNVLDTLPMDFTYQEILFQDMITKTMIAVIVQRKLKPKLVNKPLR